MVELKKKNIQAFFHFIPLHNSPMGKSFGSKDDDMPVTKSISNRILRLPLYTELKISELDYVLTHLFKSLGEDYNTKEKVTRKIL